MDLSALQTIKRRKTMQKLCEQKTFHVAHGLSHSHAHLDSSRAAILRTMNCRQESLSCSALYKAANSSNSAAFLSVTANRRSTGGILIKKKQVCLDHYHHCLFLFALLALNALQVKSLCLIYNKNTLEKCGQYFINSAISSSCLRKHNKRTTHFFLFQRALL